MSQLTYNGAKIEQIARLNGEDHVNTWWVVANTGGAATQAELGTLCTEFNAWWVACLRALLSSAYVLLQWRATDQATVGGPENTYTPTTSIAGANTTSPCLPNNVAICATLITNKTGRRYRGRKYFGGLTQSQESSTNIMSAAQVTAWSNCIGALVDRLITNTRFRLGVRSSLVLTPVVGLGSLATVEQITDVLVDNILDSQRRRLPGRGS